MIFLNFPTCRKARNGQKKDGSICFLDLNKTALRFMRYIWCFQLSSTGHADAASLLHLHEKYKAWDNGTMGQNVFS